MRSSAQERLSDALADLANARTPEEIDRAEKAVAAAKVAVERENAENQERLKKVTQALNTNHIKDLALNKPIPYLLRSKN